MLKVGVPAWNGCRSGQDVVELLYDERWLIQWAKCFYQGANRFLLGEEVLLALGTRFPLYLK